MRPTMRIVRLWFTKPSWIWLKKPASCLMRPGSPNMLSPSTDLSQTLSIQSQPLRGLALPQACHLPPRAPPLAHRAPQRAQTLRFLSQEVAWRPQSRLVLVLDPILQHRNRLLAQSVNGLSIFEHTTSGTSIIRPFLKCAQLYARRTIPSK